MNNTDTILAKQNIWCNFYSLKQNSPMSANLWKIHMPDNEYISSPSSMNNYIIKIIIALHLKFKMGVKYIFCGKVDCWLWENTIVNGKIWYGELLTFNTKPLPEETNACITQ